MLGTEEYQQISEKVKKSEKRLLFFDYDGTLMPLVKLPSLSAPNENLIRVLSLLTSDKKNNVVVISGRDSGSIGKWLGGFNLVIVAEHGALIKYPGEKWKSLSDEDDEWKKKIISVMETVTQKCQGSFIEEKKFTMAWHYRNAAIEPGNFYSRKLIRALTELINGTSLQVLDGNKIVEVRFMKNNKGAIAKRIEEEVMPDFIMAIGDDRTDEDMFEALGPGTITIKIGTGPTRAAYTLSLQEDVTKLLKNLFLKT